MARELLLLRAGIAEPKSSLDDFHLPLAEPGKRAAQRIGAWLLRQNLLPDRVLSSPAERTMVTAEKTVHTLGMAATWVISEDTLYRASLGDLIELLKTTPAATRRLLLVAHNPGLERLVHHLADQVVENSQDGSVLPPTALARLTLDVPWERISAGCSELGQIIRPASLPDRFPFPTPGGEEFRERPAYCFTQSAVIPYRFESGGLEILLISSKSGKHPQVPKGVVEPGLTPQRSAAREAWEEAGVEGSVRAEPLGSYDYKKWGGVCHVTVFAMEVTRVLSEQEWRESHRSRSWVSADQAADVLKHRGLVPMIEQLVVLLAVEDQNYSVHSNRS